MPFHQGVPVDIPYLHSTEFFFPPLSISSPFYSPCIYPNTTSTLVPPPPSVTPFHPIYAPSKHSLGYHSSAASYILGIPFVPGLCIRALLSSNIIEVLEAAITALLSFANYHRLFFDPLAFTLLSSHFPFFRLLLSSLLQHLFRSSRSCAPRPSRIKGPRPQL